MAEKVKKSATDDTQFSNDTFVVKEEFENIAIKEEFENVTVKEEFENIVIKEEFVDNDYINDEMCISQTTIAAERNDQIKQYEICGNTLNDNVKREGEVFDANNIKTEFDSGLLFCNHCQEISHDYCTECDMLVHVLNPNILGNTCKRETDETPKGILEIKELFGRLGIFASKVIPEGVKFGPFTGLSASGYCWRLKRGKLVVDKDKLKFLNWVRHINPARSISEQNLLAFQCDNNLYYRSVRKIQVHEELLVYFGEEHDGSLNKDVEVDFIPTVEEDKRDVFACTFCCFGFSSKAYLNAHKIICPNKINETFSIEELMQCPFCTIHLDKTEYFDYHMYNCGERSEGNCVPPMPDNHTVEVHKSRTQRCRVHKCTHCKYRTTYRGDLQSHANKHYEVKIYKCGICNSRFKMRGYLKMHVERIHADVEMKDAQKWLRSEYMKTHVKVRRSKDETKQFGCIKSEPGTNCTSTISKRLQTKHLKEFNFHCTLCEYKANQKINLEIHVKTKHLKEFSYECETCDYKTNNKSHLELHTKTKHLKEFSYECEICKYKTNNKAGLERHIDATHLKEFKYKCEMCDYKAKWQSNLKVHMKTKHLDEFNYKCDLCDAFKTNNKSNLELHTKAKHLKEFNHKCGTCDYKTNNKSHLERHVKTKHLKEFDYSHSCETCDYRTSNKSHLKLHVKTKHLKEFKYKCELCELKTNQKSNLERHMKAKHLK